MKVAVGIGLALVAWAGAGHAGEDQPKLSLRWNAPDECPDDAVLVRSVEQQLDQPLSEARQQSLAISANVVGEPSGGFAAKLRFAGPNGTEERFLEHPDCAKLTEAVALLMALAIDPERVKARQQAAGPAATVAAPKTEPSSGPGVPPPAAERASAPARDDAPPALPTRSTERAWRPRVGVFGFAGSGSLPSVGPGLGVEVSLRARYLELGLVGRYWLSRVEPVPGVAEADVRLALASLGLRGCGVAPSGAWQLRGCAGAELGDLWGTGEGAVEQPRTGHALLPSLSASLTLSYGGQGLIPFAGVEGALALSRAPFGVAVNGRDLEVFRPSVGALQAFIGLAYQL